MSLGQIIRSRREELGLTQELLAGQVGISKPYLSNIETGRANPPSDGVLRAAERALSFRPGELVRMAHRAKTPPDILQSYEEQAAENRKLRSILRRIQTGQDVDADEARSAVAQPADDDSPAEVDTGLVPVINKVSAGYPQYFTDLDYPPGVADEYIRCPDVHDPQAFATRVVGDSMAPDYREGDIVVFSPNTEARSGDDCFVRFDVGEGTTFKRVYEDDPDTLRLQPLNNAYPARTVPRDTVTGVWPAVFRIQRIRK